MKILIRTLANKVFSFDDLSEDSSVGELKTLITESLLVEEEAQRLVFRGNLLENNKSSLKENDVADESIIVLYLARNPIDVDPDMDVDSSKEDSAREGKPVGKDIKKITKELLNEMVNPNAEEPEGVSASTVSPEFVDAVTASLGLGSPNSRMVGVIPSLLSSLQQQQQGGASAASPPSPASIPLMIPNVDEEALTSLSDMGFPRERARRALLLNGMDPQASMEWLLDHSDDPDIDRPLSREELGRIFRHQRPPFQPDPEAVASLESMGFPREAAVRALRLTRGDAGAACNYLLENAGR